MRLINFLVMERYIRAGGDPDEIAGGFCICQYIGDKVFHYFDGHCSDFIHENEIFAVPSSIYPSWNKRLDVEGAPIVVIDERAGVPSWP